MTEKSHVIDRCELCGFVSYSVITSCPVCGNRILTSEILDEETFRNQEKAGFKARVKQILNSPVWQDAWRKQKKAQ